MQTIADAKKSVRRMKRAAPEMFYEWQELRNAEANLKHARARLEKARKAWKKVGA